MNYAVMKKEIIDPSAQALFEGTFDDCQKYLIENYGHLTMADFLKECVYIEKI